MVLSLCGPSRADLTLGGNVRASVDDRARGDRGPKPLGHLERTLVSAQATTLKSALNRDSAVMVRFVRLRAVDQRSCDVSPMVGSAAKVGGLHIVVDTSRN
jgi:hypothetical protein